MFQKVGGWVANIFAFHSVKSLVRENEWLRLTMLKVTTDLNQLEGAEEHPFLDFVQTDETTKQEVAGRLGSHLTDIARSEDQVLANRKWIVELARENAQVKSFFVSKQDCETSDSPHYHPCAAGFLDHPDLIIEVIKNNFTERLDECDGDLDKAFETLRIWSLQLHYELSIANLVRVSLDDVQRDRLDWYGPYINATVALAETDLRKQLGVEMPCNPSKIQTEQSFIEINILSGKDDPLIDVIFAKRYGDWEP